MSNLSIGGYGPSTTSYQPVSQNQPPQEAEKLQQNQEPNAEKPTAPVEELSKEIKHRLPGETGNTINVVA